MQTSTNEYLQVGPPLQAPLVDDDRIGDIMQPAGYRILVEILPTNETLKRWKDSKLAMPDEARDREWQAQVWAKVIRLGPLAYGDKERYGDQPWCKPGDQIMMRPYSGTRFQVRGRLYALINDDTVQAVVGDVSELERA
jgi:co-chaperonin GroES (HSP10)